MAFLNWTQPLAAGATKTLGSTNSQLADRIVGTVFSDQAGTHNIEQSFDDTNFDVSTSYTITANDGSGFSEELVAPYVRLRYVNGGTPQTVFRLYSRFSSGGPR